MTELSIKYGVYIVQEGTRNIYKVGQSMNIDSRIETMQTSNSNKLKLNDYFETTELHIVESAAHKYIESKKIHGEWFELDDNELNMLKKFIRNTIQNIDTINTLSIKKKKKEIKYKCEECKYLTDRKNDYTRHIVSEKHLRNQNDISKNNTNTPNDNTKSTYKCKYCENIYSRSCSLTRHMNKCSQIRINILSELLEPRLYSTNSKEL